MEKAEAITPAPQRNSTSSNYAEKLDNSEEAFEVFKREGASVDFRTVGWIQASVIFLKRKCYGTTYFQTLHVTDNPIQSSLPPAC